MRSGLSRRELFKLGGLSLAASVIPGIASTAAAQTPRGKAGRQSQLRNVIMLVSDGMSAGVVSLADSFSRLVRDKDTSTHWVRLMQTPGVAQGMVETYSLNSMVTDSAAAASAWGSGSRVNNGSINILPNGTKLTPLATLLKQAGKRVGLLTTCSATHATPAGFAAVQPKRGNEREIAIDYLNSDIDVVMGGGRLFFEPGKYEDQRDLTSEFTQKGHAYCRNRNDLLAAQKNAPAKILGLFTDGYLPFTVDRNQSAELQQDVPTLEEMTRAAIASLSQGPNGFFLMVEGGRVDHAAHANDTAAALWDQLAFDDAIGAALEFAAGRDDTLIIVTTDHANSNPGLNSMGSKTGGTNNCFARIANITGSAGVIHNAIRKAEGGATPENVKQAIKQYTQLEIPDDHADTLARILRKEKISELSIHHANPVGVLGQILGNFTGIGWTSVSHTADYATLSAIGVGASNFAGFGRNIDAFSHITRMLGIDHVNPSLTPAEAWRFVDASQPLPDEVAMA